MPKCSAPGRVGARRIGREARRLRIEAAAELDQPAADQHLAQKRASSDLPRTSTTVSSSNSHAMRSPKGLPKPTAHSRVDACRASSPARPDRFHAQCGPTGSGRASADSARSSRARRRTSCRASGCRRAAWRASPACTRCEIGAALVAEPQLESRSAGMRAAVARISSPTSSAGNRACGVYRRSRSRKYVIFTQRCPLARSAMQNGRDDRAEPGRDDERRASSSSGFDRVGNVQHLRCRLHVLANLGASRACQAADGIHHARIEQRVGEHQHLLARPDREHAREVVQRLEEVLGLRDRRIKRRRQADRNLVIRCPGAVCGARSPVLPRTLEADFLQQHLLRPRRARRG